MADNPVSYEEATEEKADRDLGDPEPEPEFDPDIRTKSVEDIFEGLETIVEAVPDWLEPGEGVDELDRPDVGGRRGQLDLGIDVAGLGQLDTQGLLEVIARVSVAQLATLFDIADAVEPFSNVTISGVNAIDDPDTAEPVVPQSDSEDIPTRVLFIRASTQNNKKLYLGDDEVQPQSGYMLGPGEFITWELDLRGEEIYMAAGESGERVQLLGMV